MSRSINTANVVNRPMTAMKMCSFSSSSNKPVLEANNIVRRSSNSNTNNYGSDKDILLGSRPEIPYGSAAISNKNFESDGDEE